MIEERPNGHFVAKDRSRRELLRSRGVRIGVITLIVLGCIALAARRHEFLYGLVSVLLSLGLGWAAAALFRRRA